jgi:cytoskeleton protein RodZ
MASGDPRSPGATVAGVTPARDGHAAGAQEAGRQNDVGGGREALPLPGGPEPMRAAEASEDERQAERFPADIPATPMELHERVEASFGRELAAAREARGWTQADVGQRLRLPARLIARLEADDYEGLTEGVFLRGYLASYARLVGLAPERADRVAQAHSSAPPLVATGTISRSRYLFERYSVSATYLVLTAIIVVPAVWLATHGGLQQNLARTTPLDPPPAAATLRDAAPAPGDATARDTAAPAEPSAGVNADAPVIASMAPFPSVVAEAPPAPPAPAPEPATAPAAGTGSHLLSLSLEQQSWVEVVAADGRKLEYGMLAAGSVHRYRSDGPLSVRIGNAQGADVRTDGAPVDLAPFQRGNVAHLRVFGDSGASRIDQ